MNNFKLHMNYHAHLYLRAAAVAVVGQSRIALNQRMLVVTGCKQNQTNSQCLSGPGY